jgi:hypothetical protein
MKRLILTICAATLVFSLTHAQTEAEKAMVAYMTPSPTHKMFAKFNGDWNEEITMWPAPGAPAQKMNATCSNKMILNGLYQESIHNGNFNGMTFEGRSTMGYDNAKKVIFSTWIDNMGSGMSYLEGNYDESSKTVTMKGKMVDPSTGKENQLRQVVKLVDDNTQLVEMYTTGADGKEFKNMEIKITRKK